MFRTHIGAVPSDDAGIAIDLELPLDQCLRLFFLAFLPQFVKPENGHVFIQLWILGTIFVLLGLLSTIVFAVSAGGLGSFLRRNPTVLRWQGKVVGTIFCALGVRLAIQDR